MTSMWFKVVTHCPSPSQRAHDPACDEPGPRAWFYSSVAVAREVAHSFTTKWPSKCLTFVPCTFWENLAGDQCPKQYQGPECHHDLVVFRPKPPRNLGYEWRALYHYPEQPGPLPFLGWVYTDAFGMAAIQKGDIRGTSAGLSASFRVNTPANEVV